MRPMVAFILVALVVMVKARFVFIMMGDDEQKQVPAVQSVSLKDAPAAAAAAVKAGQHSYIFLNKQLTDCTDWECTITCWSKGFAYGECVPSTTYCHCHN